jgi:hypothetical protein
MFQSARYLDCVIIHPFYKQHDNFHVACHRLYTRLPTQAVRFCQLALLFSNLEGTLTSLAKLTRYAGGLSGVKSSQPIQGFFLIAENEIINDL